MLPLVNPRVRLVLLLGEVIDVTVIGLVDVAVRDPSDARIS
jgi:hypothetical protein